jgi:hypothetical protein
MMEVVVARLDEDGMAEDIVRRGVFTGTYEQCKQYLRDYRVKRGYSLELVDPVSGRYMSYVL